MAKEEQPSHLQGYNIVTILKRLEAATSRLEDISVFQEDANKQRKIALAAFQADARNQPEIEAQAEKTKEPAGAPAELAQDVSKELEVEMVPAPQALPEPKQIVRFQEVIQDTVMPFVAESRAVHEKVGAAAEALHRAFERELDFLKLTTQATKPLDLDPALLAALLPINSEITTILDIKDKFRSLEVAPHLCTIAEGAPSLSWIVSPLPLAILGDYRDLMTFWSNRVLKDFKEKDNNMKEWVRLLNAMFTALTAHVKEFYATGVKWNDNSPKSLAELVAERDRNSKIAAASSPALGGSAPPPPPPPPPAEFYQDAQSDNAEKKPVGGMGAVFADLNQGVSVTSGLKKVDKLLMTHKNPQLRQKGSISSKPAPPKKPSSLSQPTAAAVKKPARMELVDGSKWMVENYGLADAPEPIVIEAEMHQSVFIGHCNGVTIDVRGKANAVTISETVKTAVVLNSLISGVDVIKSVKFGIQVTGVVPMMSVDKSDEGTIYLSQESVDANVQIYTSCTTGLNVNVPEKDEYTECAVPEQFKHSIKNGKLVSEVMEHAG